VCGGDNVPCLKWLPYKVRVSTQCVSTQHLQSGKAKEVSLVTVVSCVVFSNASGTLSCSSKAVALHSCESWCLALCLAGPLSKDQHLKHGAHTPLCQRQFHFVSGKPSAASCKPVHDLVAWEDGVSFYGPPHTAAGVLVHLTN
jgi:hypothetical protein